MIRALIRTIRDFTRHTRKSKLTVARTINAGAIGGAVARARLFGTARSAPTFTAVAFKVHRAQAMPIAVLGTGSLLAAFPLVPGVALTYAGVAPAVVGALVLACLAGAATSSKTWVAETLTSLAHSTPRTSLRAALCSILDVTFRARHILATGPSEPGVARAVAVHGGVVDLLLLALTMVGTRLVWRIGGADGHFASLTGPAGGAFTLSIAATVPSMVAGVFAGVDSTPRARVGTVALASAVCLTSAVRIAAVLAGFFGASGTRPRLALEHRTLRHRRTSTRLVDAGAVPTTIMRAERLSTVISAPSTITFAGCSFAVLALHAGSVKAAPGWARGDCTVKTSPGLFARARAIIAALAVLGAVTGAGLCRTIVACPHLPVKGCLISGDRVASALASGCVTLAVQHNPGVAKGTLEPLIAYAFTLFTGAVVKTVVFTVLHLATITGPVSSAVARAFHACSVTFLFVAVGRACWLAAVWTCP